MNSPETKQLNLTYEERQALPIFRKAIKRRPEIINELMKDMAYESAVSILLQAKRELAQLLEVNRAFVAAASVLAKQQKEQTNATDQQA